MTIDPLTVTRRYFLTDTETGELFQDCLLSAIEADNLNVKYAADGSSKRWQPFRERGEDSVAA